METQSPLKAAPYHLGQTISEVVCVSKFASSLAETVETN